MSHMAGLLLARTKALWQNAPKLKSITNQLQ